MSAPEFAPGDRVEIVDGPRAWVLHPDAMGQTGTVDGPSFFPGSVFVTGLTIDGVDTFQSVPASSLRKV